MWNHTWNKTKQLAIVHFQKYTFCHAVFYRIINAFPRVLKDVAIIFFSI